MSRIDDLGFEHDPYVIVLVANNKTVLTGQYDQSFVKKKI